MLDFHLPHTWQGEPSFLWLPRLEQWDFPVIFPNCPTDLHLLTSVPYCYVCLSICLFIHPLGWPKISFQFSLRTLRKNPMNFLANPVCVYLSIHPSIHPSITNDHQLGSWNQQKWGPEGWYLKVLGENLSALLPNVCWLQAVLNLWLQNSSLCLSWSVWASVLEHHGLARL